MHMRRALLGSLALVVSLMALVVAGQTGTGSGGTASDSAATGTTKTDTTKTDTIAPSVVIVQATTAGALDLGTLPTQRVEWPISIEEQAGGIAKGFEVRAEKLLHVKGAVPLTFTPAETLPKELPPAKLISGTLTANLPYPGAYTSSIRLIYNGKVQKTYAVTMTRAADAVAAAPTDLPLDPGELPDILAEVCAYRCGTQTIVATTTLAPKDAETVTLAAPSLRSLTVKLGDKTVASDDVTLEITDTAEKPQPVKFPLTLNPGETKPLRLAFRNVDGAGQYTAKLQFLGAGRKPFEKSFTIYAREGWRVAFFFTFLGVLGSWALRRWFTRGRPKLALELRPSRLNEELNGAEVLAREDKVAREVIAALRAQVAQAWTRAVATEKWTETSAFDLLDRKVNLLQGWVLARHGVLRTKPASVGAAVATELDTIEQFLRAPGGTDEIMKKHEASLAELPKKLREAVIKEIQAQLKAFEDQLTEILKQRPSLRDSIEAKVRPPLAEVEAILNGPDIDMDAAQGAIRRARHAYALVLAEALRADLEKAPPARVDGPVWSKLKKRLRAPLEDVRTAKDGDAAMRAFEGALAEYARTIAASLLETATEEERKAHEATITSLEGVDAKIATGKVFEAWKDVVAAQKALTPDVPAVATSDDAPLVPAAFAGDDLVGEGVAGGTINELPDFRPSGTVASHMRAGDLIADIAAVAIAAMVGIGVLWKPSLSWGGILDHLAAIGWGLGVHQVAYNGLSSIFEKFTGSR